MVGKLVTIHFLRFLKSPITASVDRGKERLWPVNSTLWREWDVTNISLAPIMCQVLFQIGYGYSHKETGQKQLS